jgi:DNA-binding beta-propeller fold protein YncE
MPEWHQGKPTGLSIHPDGSLMVADTHYHRVLFYSPLGELLANRTLGGTAGLGEGEFGFVTDVAVDSQGQLYVSEYGDCDRIQKFDAAGNFLAQWGTHGSQPGQFLRPQCLQFDKQDRLWVADACNHRIQVFDTSADAPVRLPVTVWGRQGTTPGRLRYPYSLLLTDQETVLVCEFGNSRIQEFTREGQFLRGWGGPGRGTGQFHSPWSIDRDDAGRLFVLDTYNHRIQRIQMK